MISLNWVKDYIDIETEDVHDLAVKITKAGVNIEKVVDCSIPNLVIGKIKSCLPHPNSDHLHVCMVDVGKEVLQIVCGAPNVKENLKVIVALPGAILPGNVLIKAGAIRGEESNGMLCALFELGVEEKTEENYAKGIHEVNNDVEVGSDANIYLGISDCLYELDVHKHRNNDCYYHIGFAYEIACILNKKVTLPPVEHSENNENINDFFHVEVNTEKCPFYLARMVRNVKIKESPDFIKKRLTSAGMRSINNVVDISNYVMLEFGQPLHFFDKDSLGEKIVVRNAFLDETIETLDGIQRNLQVHDLVITDGEKPVCIAGVMGGLNTEVKETTKNILIESAIFDAVSIRNTAARLNLKSEASIRYGKGLNYEYTKMAIERACHLLEKYADAEIVSGVLSHDVIDKKEKIVSFQTGEINALLGITLTDEEIEKELNRLDFPYQKKEKAYVVTIPRRRLDIDPNVSDIAEEIGRLYGYHNLVSTLPVVKTKRGEYKGDVKIRKYISKRLRSLGLNECKTYTLISPSMAEMFLYDGRKPFSLPNPMSVDKSIIRTSILPSLLQVYAYNKARGVKDIFLYEIAKTYDEEFQEVSKVSLLMKGNYLSNVWQQKTIGVDFFLIKGIVVELLDYLGFKNRYTFVKEAVQSLHPGMSATILLDRQKIGVIGRVHPSVEKDEVYVCELSMKCLYEAQMKPIRFKEASKYPEIVKDVSFLVADTIDSETIKNCIIKYGKRILYSVHVFDVYPNFREGKKSIAYKLVFKDNTRTLQEEEVMVVFNEIISQVEKMFQAQVRDK